MPRVYVHSTNVRRVGCNSVAWTCGHLGVHLPRVYAHSALCETYGL